MGFLPSCGCISTVVWQQHLKFNEGLGELHKVAALCFEQILETTPYKIAAIRPLISHLTSHPRKANKTCWALLENQERTHNRHSPVDSYAWMYQNWPTNKYLRISAQCGHWIQSSEPARSYGFRDGWQDEVKRIQLWLDDDDDDDENAQRLECSPMARETWVQSQVESYQRL